MDRYHISFQKEKQKHTRKGVIYMWGECIIYMPATESAMAMSNEWLGKMKEIDRKVLKMVDDNENISHTIYVKH